MPDYKLVNQDEHWFLDNIQCMTACPVHTEAFGYIRSIKEKDYDTAFAIAKAPNPFAGVCARVCGHPCETECRRGRIDEPVSIRALKRTAAERSGYWVSRFGPSPARKRTGPKVAVIGAGPAGLACAHDLAILDYQPTIFEASSVVGGMLYLGLPEYRLPREVTHREVNEIQSLGVEIRKKVALGRDFTISDLKAEGFEAIFISIGAHRSRELRIDGVDLDGVVRGVEFLLNVNLGYHMELGERVIVIGGGNVAMDIARTALRGTRETVQPEPPEPLSMTVGGSLDVARLAQRLGARDVQLVCLEAAKGSRPDSPKEEMPAWDYEIREAEEEGIRVRPSLGPNRILGENGRVKALEVRRCLSVFDENGRFSPTFEDGSETALECDSVILAIGQQADFTWIREGDGLEVTPRATLVVDSETLETTAPYIFAGGDAAFGPRLIINAVADGRKAAKSIHKKLTGQARLTHSASLQYVQIRPVDDPYQRISRHEPPAVPTQRRVGFAEVEMAYTEEEAAEESNRCLQCDLNIFIDGQACILCGGCIDICPNDCIEMVALASVSGTEDTADVLEETSAEHAAMLLNENHCIRCGLCVRRCPTHAISMHQFSYSEVWNRE